MELETSNKLVIGDKEYELISYVEIDSGNYVVYTDGVQLDNGQYALYVNGFSLENDEIILDDVGEDELIQVIDFFKERLISDGSK